MTKLSALFMLAFVMTCGVRAELVEQGQSWSASTPLFDDTFYNSPFLEFENAGDYTLTLQNLGLSESNTAPTFDQLIVALFSFEDNNPLNATTVTTVQLDTLGTGSLEISETLSLLDSTWGSYRLGMIGQAANGFFGNASVALTPVPLTSVPLPMPFLLLGSALGALLLYRRDRLASIG